MKKLLILIFILLFPCFIVKAEDTQLSETDNTLNPDQQKDLQLEEAKEDKIDVFEKRITKGTYKKYKISAIDPTAETNKKSKYFQSARGKDQLVIYTQLYGKSTNTDTKGLEAVIVNNKVVKINHYNSYIPLNGYVVSGQGKAKKFIEDNMFEGIDVDVDFKNGYLKVAAYQDNYIFTAKYRIEKAKEVMRKSDESKVNTDDMEFYIKKSEELLEKAKKAVQFEDYEKAPELAKDSVKYSDMAIYTSLAFKSDEEKGIWVLPYQHNINEITQAFDIIERLGINNIYLSVYYRGFTVYPSDVMKKYGMPLQHRKYKDVDILDVWIKLAKAHNKKVYVVFKTFDAGNPEKSKISQHILSIHPDWANKTKISNNLNGNLYLDPANPEVQNFLIELMSEVFEKYDVAGIVANDVKYPDTLTNDVENSWGYTKTAVNDMDKAGKINLLTLKKGDFYWQKWLSYKEDKINEFVDKYSKIKHPKDTTLAITAEFNGINNSQNYAKWKLDKNGVKLLPKLVSVDSDFAQDFIKEIRDVYGEIELTPVYFEPNLEESPRYLFEQITVARKNGINSMIIYDLDSFNKELYDALRLCIFRETSKNKQKNLYDRNSLK